MADSDSFLPPLDKHIASLDQSFDEDEKNVIAESHSNLVPSPTRQSSIYSLNEPTPRPSAPPASPPPLIDLVTLITPKQIENSKKWSVGVNYTSTSIIFEYLDKARLSIQNDGRLFKPPRSTLSSTHSSLSPSQTNIPRISHIAVPRTFILITMLCRINREWHIGELLPVIYTANINPPTISEELTMIIIKLSIS